ncbi:MAG TPA: TolC family protein [Opitutaceae bacterium]|nr:TolC family protein [Opitutaceae bacterium]
MSPRSSVLTSRCASQGLALACAIVLTGGCVRFQPRPITPEATAEQWAARSLRDEGLHQFMQRTLTGRVPAWPVATWDADDLTLAAIYYQPGLAVARAQWEVAQAGTRTAAERPNPSVSASATYDTTTPPPWIPAVSFDVPIETAGKRGYRMAQAEALAAAARWDLIQKIWDTRAAVRSALVGVYNARESARLLQRQENAQAEVVRLLEGQLKAGAVAQADVTPARIARDTTRLALEQARQQETEARAGLADAIGIPASALDHTALSFAGLDRFPAPQRVPEMRREAVLHRADIRSALASYAASQSALQLELANQYPDIHLGPGYEFDQTDNKWTLGITLPLPIMNQDRGPIAEAEARRKLSAAQFVAVQARALGEIDVALAGYRSALAQSRTAAELLDQLQRRLNSARAMQQAGEVDPLAVASADVEYATSAAQHLDALIKAQQALGRLEAAVQSPQVIPDTLVQQVESVPSP